MMQPSETKVFEGRNLYAEYWFVNDGLATSKEVYRVSTSVAPGVLDHLNYSQQTLMKPGEVHRDIGDKCRKERFIQGYIFSVNIYSQVFLDRGLRL